MSRRGRGLRAARACGPGADAIAAVLDRVKPSPVFDSKKQAVHHKRVIGAATCVPRHNTWMTFLRMLRQLAIVEGISTLVLFGIAMPLKYFAGLPLAVTVAGSIHGLLFVMLVAMLAVATRTIPISLRVAAVGVVAAVVPGGPFLFDRTLARFEASRR